MSKIINIKLKREREEEEGLARTVNLKLKEN